MSVLKVHIYAAHPAVLMECQRALCQERINTCHQLNCTSVALFDGQLARLESQLLITRVTCPATRLLVLVFRDDENECLRWLSLGAHGVVTYERLNSDLPHAMQKLSSG